MPVWTNTPQNLTVSNPTQVTNGPIQFDVTIDNLEIDVDAVVCLKKDDEDYAYQTVTGTGSPVTASFYFTPDTPGDLDVTITAHNHVPYEAQVPVTLTNYAHLYIGSYTIDDDNNGASNGNGDGIIDAGETIEMTVTVKNSGDSDANDVVGVMSATSGGIIFFSNTQSFGTIAAGGSAISQGNYVFMVVPDAEDGEYVEFHLDMTDAASNDYEDYFYYQIYAAEILMTKTVIEDGGDGIQPYEEVGLFIDLTNFGSGEATGLTATLVSNSSFTIDITDGIKNYGDILSMETITNADDFNFAVNDPNYQTGDQIDLKLTIENSYGKTWEHDFNLNIPDTPVNLKFTSSQYYIDVSWDPVFTDVKGYNVYRADSETGPYEKLNQFIIQGTSYYKDEPLPEKSTFYYKVQCVSPAGVESVFSAALKAWTTLSYLSGWPISPDFEPYVFGSISVFDTDGDGQEEIFNCTYEGDGGRIMGWHASADEMFNIDNNNTTVSGFANLNATAFCTPAIGDIDNDGKIDIVVTTRNNGTNQKTVFAYKTVDDGGDGLPDQLWTRVLNAPTLRGAVLSDLDGDDYLEIVVPTEHGSIYVLDHSGNDYAPAWPKLNVATGSNYGMPAVADLNGDGYQEIIMGFRSGVYIWKHDGSDFTSNPFFASGSEWFVSPPVVVDIDNDGDYEIMLLSTEDGSTTGKIYALHHDGNLVSGWTGSNTIPLSSEAWHPTRPPAIAVGDLDMDMDIEVVVGGYGHLIIWDHEGNLVENIGVSDLDVWDGAPVLADIDGDPEIEMIIASHSQNLHAFNMDGTKVGGWPLRLNDGCDGTPSVSDVDGDGKSEVIVAVNDYTHIWKTDGNPNNIQWSSYRNNPQNTGVYVKRGLFGSLPENSQITWSGTINIIGDIVLPHNSVLTILPGTEIIFEEGDFLQSGNDPNRSELIIEGELIAQGQSTNKIVFTSNTSHGWYGVIANPDAELNLSYCCIDKAVRGIEIKPAHLLYVNHQINHCEISNCGYGIYVSSNSANIQYNQIHDNNIGIYLFESEYTIYENDIYDSRDHGIYLSNSSYGEIINNRIYSNSSTEADAPYAGVLLYQSSPRMFANLIYSNLRNGTALLNSSFPVIEESNLIAENGPIEPLEEPAWDKAEILMQDISTPYMNYGHNDIYDTRVDGGYLMMHSGEVDELIVVDGNYWGGDSPEGLLYPAEYYEYDGWDTEPNTSGIPQQMSPEQELFITALQNEQQGDYNSAKSGYLEIISNYPDSIETAYSLPRLFICEQALNGDFAQLQTYYSNFSQSSSDSVNAKIAERLTRRCLVKQLLLNDAIVEYESIVQNPPSLADSVYAVIDIGDIYLLQGQFGSGGGQGFGKGASAATPQLMDLKPESDKQFEIKKKELLALLFNQKQGEDINKPKYYGLSQNYPNPFNPITIIKYQLPKTTNVKLDIYNILGQRVKTLVDAQQPADYYTIEWDGKNNHGKQVGSGLYIYRLIAEATNGSENFVKVKKMLLIR